jgi:hypothetical protein
LAGCIQYCKSVTSDGNIFDLCLHDLYILLQEHTYSIKQGLGVGYLKVQAVKSGLAKAGLYAQSGPKIN